MNRMTILLWLALSGLLAPLSVAASHSGVVEAKLPSGVIVGAGFHAGKPGMPAVLVLHGFLQTQAFPTVASLAEALSTAGYTVLTPTLSLGVSGRKASLACEALHLHTLEEDVAEVAFWTRWLEKKGHRHLILVGHSFGNLQLLRYLQKRPTNSVKQVVMISLTDVEVKQSAEQRAKMALDLRNRIARQDNGLTLSEFGHCKKYPSPPAALLSYLIISRQIILDSLATVPVPVSVIMGGADDRMGQDWTGRLISRGMTVQVVPGASHFFDNQYEFDLQEAVLKALHKH